MKKIAICIPTFNRPKVIFDTCSKITNIVDSDLADIYVYDSSTDDETKKVFEKIERNNFFYIRIDPSVHSSKKVYAIYQEKKIQNNHEYLWVLADYLFFDKSVIREVISKLNEEWDMLMLDFYDPQGRGNRQYHSPNAIFYEYAWSMTQYGIILINCKTVLKKADWRYLTERYLTDDHKNFSHIMMYFEVMLQLDRLKFYHFSISRENVYISKYKSVSSDYLDDFLNVWGDRWYRSINALPRFYKNKSRVIKMACKYTASLGEKNIAELKCRGILTIRSFQRYIPIWHCVSTVPAIIVYVIIFLPDDIARRIVKYGSIKTWLEYIFQLERIKVFCKKYDTIYLYGAGEKAKMVADLMIENSISFKGFVVTDINENITF